MVKRITFEKFDDDLAEAAKHYRAPSGLPAFLGIAVDEFLPGRLVASIEVRPELMNHFGVMHGGVISALVDHCLGGVVYPVVPAGHWVATTEYKINLVAPVRQGKVTCCATIVSLSTSLGVVTVEVINEDRVVAVAQGTVIVKAPRNPG